MVIEGTDSGLHHPARTSKTHTESRNMGAYKIAVSGTKNGNTNAIANIKPPSH